MKNAIKIDSFIIPTLYRGDSDENELRYLRTTSHYGQLQTNLINGGKCDEINEDWKKLLDKHVNIGWNSTHFLSFSENKNTAIRFGLNVKNLNEGIPEIYETSRDTRGSFAIIKMNSDKIEFIRDNDVQGIYHGKYKPGLTMYQHLTYFEIIAINVTECIVKNKFHIPQAKKNSMEDREWLLLPNTKTPISGAICRRENSAILDMGQNEEFEVNWYMK